MNAELTIIVVVPMVTPVPRLSTKGMDCIGDVPNTAFVEIMTPKDRKNNPAMYVGTLLIGWFPRSVCLCDTHRI